MDSPDLETAEPLLPDNLDNEGPRQRHISGEAQFGTRRLSSQLTSSGVQIDGEPVDFGMVLSDVSSYRSSKAKRFLKSMWIFGKQQLADVDAALAQLLSSLEQHGFRARQVQAEEGDGLAGPDDILLLLTGTPERLSREDYREQLDLWIQQRGLGEFSARTTNAADYSPARRVQLLEPALSALVPELQRHALRGADLVSIRGVFPLHDRQFNLRLVSHLTRHVFLQAHMLHQLRNVYGEKVAFLFAFRNFYQRCLLVPALLGVLLSLSQRCFSRGPALIQPLYGLGISLWGTAVLRAWRRQRSQLAALWGVEGAHETEVVRAEFKGERVVSHVTGEATLWYPAWKRALKRCVTVPILVAQLLLLTGIIIGLYVGWLRISASDHNAAVKTTLIMLLSVLWGVLVEFLNWNVFLRLALLLNRWENYRTTRDFEQQLVLKLFAFLFVDGFLWYFLLAFLHIPFGDQIARVLDLGDPGAVASDGAAGSFWMHALTTSISTLLVLCVPLATLMTLAPVALRYAGLSPLRCLSGCSALSTSIARLVPRPRSPYKLLTSPPEHAGRRSPDPAAGATPDAAAAAPSAADALLPAPVVRLCAADSDSDSDACSELWGSSYLAGRLNWSPLRRAQRQQRSALISLRRTLRHVLASDSLLEESRRPEFDTMLDLARLSLEFGYVLMFTVIWPLAPLASLLISGLEQRATCVRLTVGSQRPAGPRCSGLGTGDAWFDIFCFLAGVSTVVNCGMIALSTPQLDVYFEAPLPPFQKLLLAVGAEHLLLLAKLALHIFYPDTPDLLQADVRRVEREFKQKFRAGLGGAAAAAAPARGALAASAPQLQLSAAYPSSGPLQGGTEVSVRGACLGQAVSRGEIALALLLPRAAKPVLVQATFVSDSKLTCTLPPSPHPGAARLSVHLPDGAPPADGAGAAALEFRYYHAASVSRLRPAAGPIQGGTAVRVLGSGFVQTGEICVCVRMRGVEQRVPAAFISEGEVRFMLPTSDFQEAGEARVQLSLNGQQFDAGEPLVFQYHHAVQCVIS